MAEDGAGGDRPRLPTAEELALWLRVTRDVRTTRPRPPEAPEPSPPSTEPPAQAAPARVPPAPPRPPEPESRRLDPHRPIDLDRGSWQRLRRGRYPVDARLDLHGLRQAEAHAALVGFLAAAQARGNRCVLIITGRGLASGGTLRDMVPRWLDTAPSRARVLAYAPAHPRHGGAGALYVLLRRA
jgi:DNA-nicking Smr family endonuclease